ncbi:hypothetical protein L5515_017235 [Caenorhabditis briggsae]|uniref:Uncharacterized protein n=1 Tax=Caenorhabditis briggsae TaxID=6238 RepID=A0AAE9FJ21_CAEBR|nr:hypothetical protein L5515_017235 [Caenorhabditis briggsae]
MKSLKLRYAGTTRNSVYARCTEYSIKNSEEQRCLGRLECYQPCWQSNDGWNNKKLARGSLVVAFLAVGY